MLAKRYTERHVAPPVVASVDKKLTVQRTPRTDALPAFPAARASMKTGDLATLGSTSTPSITAIVDAVIPSSCNSVPTVYT